MPDLQDPCPKTRYYFNLLWKYNNYLIAEYAENNINARLLSGYEVNEKVLLIYKTIFENCFDNGKTITGHIYADALLIIENEKTNGKLSDKLQMAINEIILQIM